MDRNQKFVITIAREVGSGGRTVGRRLAEKLGVRYSDKELVRALVEKFGLSVYEIERLKGEKKNWLTDFIQWVAPVPSVKNIIGFDAKFAEDFRPDVTSSDVFKAESEIIRGIADNGSCVIAGRSGYFILKDHPNRLDVFITASRDSRIRRVMLKQGLTAEEAGIVIDSVDTARENYIKNFTGGSRYDARNYDLVINSDGHTEEQIADIILSYIG